MAVTLCLVVVLTAVLASSGRQAGESRRADALRASPAAAAAALASFVDGVDARDSAALAAVAASDDPDAEKALSGIARNAATLRLRGVSARFVDQIGTVAADGSWTGIVDLTWQLGAAGLPSRADVPVTFVPRSEGLGIAGFDADGGGRTRVPLWLRGELSVVRADHVLVLVDGPRSEAQRVADRVSRGIDVVRRVLPDWTSPVVVEVPASAADLEQTVGAAPGTYAAIAAVTTTAGSGVGSDAPVHVFVNPDVTAGLQRAAAQMVMTHELVHVATDAARTPMEPWLTEGFADYVALRDTTLSDPTTLGRAIAAARRRGVPTALPSVVSFDSRGRNLQARYEEAWLACRIIAERRGEQGLVAVYDAVAGGASAREALRGVGLSSGGLTRAWRGRLRDLVG